MKISVLSLLLAFNCFAFQTKWYEAEKNAKGIALTIHGLNLDPIKMEGIIHELQEMGISSINLSLSGHAPNELAKFRSVTADTWKNEFMKAYSIASNRAEEEHLPLYFVGFSLGGLLGVSSLNEKVTFEKMILFAPAIQIKTASKVFKILSFAPRLIIPSASPKKYRANNGTPIAAYSSLYSLQASLNKINQSHLNIPSLIFCSEKDELVSFSKIEDMIEKNHLSNWKLFSIAKEPIDEKLSYKHLIIDSQSVGDAEWSRILSLMSSFLTPEA